MEMRRLNNLNQTYGKVLGIYEIRLWGESKLKKPKELRGIKPLTSIKIDKTSHQVFVKNSDVWVKHRDFFSQTYYNHELNGAPLNTVLDNTIGKERPKKFIYGDAWGDLVLRNEAWLIFPDMIEKYDIDFVKCACFDLQKMLGIPWHETMISDIGRFLDALLSYVAHEYTQKGFIGDKNNTYFKKLL